MKKIEGIDYVTYEIIREECGALTDIGSRLTYLPWA